MENVKFGLLIGGEQPWVLAKDCVKLTIQAEKDGYDVAWIPDHLVDLDASRADPWSIFGYLSAVTKSISFCTAVTDFQKIHPSKLAQIVGTIDELSNGRVILGLGTGEAMNNTPFGVKWDDVKTRIARFEEYIKVIRLLWSSNIESRVNFNGEHYQLDDAWIDQGVITKPEPPICIAAIGAKRMLKVVGKYANIWFPTFLTADLYREKLNIVHSAAKEAGRNPDDIEPTSLTMPVISSDPKIIDQEFKNLKMFVATLCPFLLEAEGIPFPETVVDINYQRMKLEDKVFEELERASEAIPDSLIQKVCPIGTVDDTISFLEKTIEAGSKHLVIAPTHGVPEENLKALREKVIPYFKSK